MHRTTGGGEGAGFAWLDKINRGHHFTLTCASATTYYWDANDGTVNAKSVYQSENSPGFAGINSPTVNFPAEGSWEHATTGTVSLPAIVITGASTSMTWKVGFSNNLNIQNITSNGAAKNILTGPGRIVVNNTLNLGAAGKPVVFDGAVLRMTTGILWTKMSELSADHPVSFTLDTLSSGSTSVETTGNLGLPAFQ